MKKAAIPFGLISEYISHGAENILSYKAEYVLVMGRYDKEGEYTPMTFEYSSGRFVYSFPSQESQFTDEIGEVYPRDVAMKLISHHVINSDHNNSQIALFPVHIPFLSPENSKGYTNPYLSKRASTKLVRDLNMAYINTYGEAGCDYKMPLSLGGDFIATGMNETNYEPVPAAGESPVTTQSSLEREQEKLDKLFSFIKGPVTLSTSDVLESFGNQEPAAATKELYMITATYDDGLAAGDTPTPLCRGRFTPLTWANLNAKDNDIRPQVFDKATAEALIKAQQEWDLANREEKADRFLMYLQPVCTDANHIADDGEGEDIVQEQAAVVTISKPLVCRIKKQIDFALPSLPDSLTVRPQYYMITGIRKGNEDDHVAGPMTRHTDCPLYFADTYGHPDEQLPSPLLFDLETAQGLIKAQQEWEEKNNWAPHNRFIMHVIPVFTDNGNVQIALIEQGQETTNTKQ